MHLFPSALQALLSLLCLLVASEVAACPLHSHDSDHATSPITAGDHDREVVRRFAASLVSSNGTLTVRNIITPGGGTAPVPSTSAIFQVGDATTLGGCEPQASVTDAWIAEAFKLHAAVETAFANWATDPGLRVLFTTYLGVQFSDMKNGVMSTAKTNQAAWAAIGSRIAGVSQFLTGGGLPVAPTNSLRPPPTIAGNPWIFCSHEFAVPQAYTDIAKDINGNDIIASTDTSTEPPTNSYLKVGDVFPTMEGREAIPFWIKQFGSYDFDFGSYNLGFGSQQTLCAKPGRYATTARIFEGIGPFSDGVPNIQFGIAVRNIRFCPLAFNPTGAGNTGNYHSATLLATAVTAANYPIGEATDPKLDAIIPISGTFYHELYHLTDTLGTTRDPYYSLMSILNAASTQNNGPQLNIPNNPESFVMFAMAAYVYLNPPPGVGKALYVGAPTAIPFSWMNFS